MRSYEDERKEQERDRVAMMLVDPTYVDLFLEPGAEHFFVQSFWRDSKLHAMFCLICELRATKEPVGYMKRLQDHGRKLLEQRKNVDNTDRLSA